MRRYVRVQQKTEAGRLDVPSDWQQGLGDYVYFIGCCPNSPMWIAYVRGALSRLGQAWQYNKHSGDILLARNIGREIEGGTCFVNCDDLLTSLGQIRDSIDNLNLSIPTGTIEARLGEIRAAIDNQTVSIDTSGLESSLSPLSAIRDRIDELGTDVFGLGNLITGITQQLALEGDDTNLTIQTAIADLSTKLIDLDDVLERSLVYEGTKLDFYGQTMTTQSDLLKEIARARGDGLVYNYSSSPDELLKTPIDYTSEFSPTVDEACVAAITYTRMQGHLLDEFASLGAPNIYDIYNLSDAYVRLIKGVLLGFTTLSPMVALEYTIDVFKELTTTEVWPDYESMAIELSQNRHEIECLYYQFLTGALDDEGLYSGFDSAVSAQLANVLRLTDLLTLSVYVYNDYLGDNSALWSNYSRERQITLDGYSEGYCGDCSGGGGE